MERDLQSDLAGVNWIVATDCGHRTQEAGSERAVCDRTRTVPLFAYSREMPPV